MVSPAIQTSELSKYSHLGKVKKPAKEAKSLAIGQINQLAGSMNSGIREIEKRLYENSGNHYNQWAG